MTQHLLSALTMDEANGRPVIHTGVSMIGLKGDDYVCSHCGRVMMTNYDISTVRPDMVYICGFCHGLNAAPEKK